MPLWKVLFILLLAGVCLALALGTIIVPFTMSEGGERWLWLGGLLTATIVMGTLFTMFLVREDRIFAGGRRY